MPYAAIAETMTVSTTVTAEVNSELKIARLNGTEVLSSAANRSPKLDIVGLRTKKRGG